MERPSAAPYFYSLNSYFLPATLDARAPLFPGGGFVDKLSATTQKITIFLVRVDLLGIKLCYYRSTTRCAPTTECVKSFDGEVTRYCCVYTRTIIQGLVLGVLVFTLKILALPVK